MKKIMLLVFCVFLISGCDAKYELNYVDNSFDEVLYVNNYIVDEDMSFLIDHYRNDKIYGDVNNTNLTTTNIKRKKNNTYDLEFNTFYSNNEYANSLAIQTCFEFHEFVEDANSLYISLYGDYYCDKFENLEVVFKSDKKINYSNAHKVSFGNYIWNFDFDDNINIEIEIDKNIDKINLNIVYIFLTIVVFVLFVFGICKIYKLYRNNREV